MAILQILDVCENPITVPHLIIALSRKAQPFDTELKGKTDTLLNP